MHATRKVDLYNKPYLHYDVLLFGRTVNRTEHMQVHVVRDLGMYIYLRYEVLHFWPIHATT